VNHTPISNEERKKLYEWVMDRYGITEPTFQIETAYGERSELLKKVIDDPFWAAREIEELREYRFMYESVSK
jgi:hypothetical protein